ncbi:unnamed protein product [Nyctereutes procyonoides]|uniref:(raccoon dog) hypothetical protein n=1 Tax=Nyctereutes procyonoides TaxID=34880 RepID=A0A811Y1G1_NYCPR|nr:unnamed protein product [Nyctereutes procyonoides]
MPRLLCTPLLLLGALALGLAVSPRTSGNKSLPQGMPKSTRRDAAGAELCPYQVGTGVVAGMNYFLDMEIGQARYTKFQPSLDNCPFYDQYTVSWLGKTSMVKPSCQDT